MANIRDYLYKKRRRSLRAQAAETGEARVIEGNATLPRDHKGQSNDTGNASMIEAHASETPQHNPTPDKQGIHRMPTKWVRRGREAARVLRYWYSRLLILGDNIWHLRWWREKSPIEIEEAAEHKRRRKLASTLKKEGRLYSRRASQAYARMRQHYVPNVSDKSFINREKRVQFDQIVGEPNAIHMRIATRQLPYGVNIRDLVDNVDIMTNVAASLGRPVEGMFTIKSGAWLTISRGGSARGLPQQVDYLKLMELMPEQAGRLTFPLGVARNSKRIYRDMTPFPHLLIGGSTGGGKSNFLNALILSIITRNNPDIVKLLMIDLKGGVELMAYRDIPHLWRKLSPDGIVQELEDVVPLLEKLVTEGQRRLKVFNKAEVPNITEYNKGKRKNRMSRVIIMIDEWANIALDHIGKEADRLMSKITATYRAVGFHVILATQRPTTQVISGLIKTNFPARLAFPVPSNVASMVILDNGSASNLATAGRAIFNFGIVDVEIQTPLVGPALVKKMVRDVIEREGQPIDDDELSMDEVFKYSLESLNGSLAQRKLFDQFQGRVGYMAFTEWLKEYDGKVVAVDGQNFQVTPSDGGAKPRRLELFQPTP